MQDVGDECTRDGDTPSDDCMAGLWCDAGCSACSGEGTCGPLCDVSTKDSQRTSCQDFGLSDKFYCFNFNDGFVPICKETCNPVDQDCADDAGCYQSDGEPVFLCSMPVLDETDGKEGSPCTNIQTCRPGPQCMNRELLADCEDESCCAYNCDLDAADPDEVCGIEGEVCLEMHADPFPGNENVGFCGAPVRK